MKEGAWSLHISIKNHDSYPVRKFIYKALTVPGKQLLVKCDQSRSRISAEYSMYTIILAACKIKCGKEKKIFQCYVIQGIGILNVML